MALSKVVSERTKEREKSAVRFAVWTILFLALANCASPKEDIVTCRGLHIECVLSDKGTGDASISIVGIPAYVYPGGRPEDVMLSVGASSIYAMDFVGSLADTFLSDYLDGTTATLTTQKVSRRKFLFAHEEGWECNVRLSGTFRDPEHGFGIIGGRGQLRLKGDLENLSVTVRSDQVADSRLYWCNLVCDLGEKTSSATVTVSSDNKYRIYDCDASTNTEGTTTLQYDFRAVREKGIEFDLKRQR